MRNYAYKLLKLFIMSNTIVKWVRPPVTMSKINCDACLKSYDFVGVEFIARNADEGVLGAGIDRIPGSFSVDCAEALLIQSAMTFAKEIGLFKVIFESDSHRVITQLQETHVNLSYVGLLMENCLYLMNVFEFVSFSHVRKESNKAAHTFTDLNPDFSFPLYLNQEDPDVITHLITLYAQNYYIFGPFGLFKKKI